MKILFLSHKFYPDIGGIEVNSEILANGFTDAGHTVHLVTWSQDKDNKTFPFFIIRNPSIQQLLQEHRWADIIFENNPSLRLSWPGLFTHKPAVVAIRTWISRENRKLSVQDRLKFLKLRQAQAVIAVSEAVRKQCWASSQVIGNPYRAHEFKIVPEVERNKDFVFLGRLVSDKGVDQAIRALYKITDQKLIDKKFSFTIIGDGAERTKLEMLVNDLNLQDQVQFTGSLRGTELVNCLNQHRYLLIPSVWEEPFGNVALEGMACGCLPIVSDGGGLPDAVGNAGIVFKRGDVDGLVKSILTVLQQPELEEKLRKAAPNHLTAHTPEIVSRKYLDVVESVLS